MRKMSKHSWAGALVLVIALWWAAPMPAHAIPFTPVVEYATSSSAGGGGGLDTLGYQFSTSIPFNINGLAYFDDGVAHNHQVGLWDSGGVLLVSTTVLASDPIQGHFHYHSIPTFMLGSGAYTIGGEYNSLSSPFLHYPLNAVGVMTVPGFVWVKAVDRAGAGLNYPTNAASVGQNGFLIPNSTTRVR